MGLIKEQVKIKVEKCSHFDNNLDLPLYKTEEAAGADVRCSLGPGEKIEIKPGERVLLPTGLIFEIPKGYEIQVRPRSGLSYKTGLMILNSPGTIDSDYRGEVKIILGNLGTNSEVISHGDRIAQLVVSPVIQAKYMLDTLLSNTSRGDGGFGSTGVK